MVNVNISHARTHLSAIIRLVQCGETVVITKRGKPVAQLKPEPNRPRPEEPESIRNDE